MTAIAYHEAMASSWDDRYRSGSFGRRSAFISSRVLPPGSITGRWLDAGSGSGTFSRLLLARGADEVIGIDGSSGMVMQARSIAQREGLGERASFEEVETVEALPMPNESFDGLICFSVFEYLPNPPAALRELARVLRRGGRAIVSIPHQHSVLRCVQGTQLLRPSKAMSPGLAYLETSDFTLAPSAAAAWFAQAGLRLVSHCGFDPFVPRFLHSFLPPSLVFYDVVRSVA